MANTHVNLIEVENGVSVKGITSISLIDFFRTGNFGPIQLGMTRQEIYGLLGEPDWYQSPDTNLMRSNIWMYEPIEFHFFDESPLRLIFTDHISYPNYWNSKRIRLDAWLFSNGYQPNKNELEAGLRKQHVPFTYIKIKPKDEGDIKGKFLFESGVEILVADVTTLHQSLRGRRKWVRLMDVAIVIQKMVED